MEFAALASSIKPSKEKTDEADLYSGDFPYKPDVDKQPGSLYDEIRKSIKGSQPTKDGWKSPRWQSG